MSTFTPLREEVEIRTTDGVSLRATVVEPAGAPRAVVIFAHAMFARRTQFDRPTEDDGWLGTFAQSGVRAIAFDFRGHGESGSTASSGGFWSFDDFVQRDLPAVFEAAAARADGAPVVVVGHSLGGSVALAAQGTKRIAADGLVVVATSIMLRRWEPSRTRFAVKRALVEGMRRTTARVGYFPARMLRQGSDDEAAPFVHDLVRFVEQDAWRSLDEKDDYAAALSAITVPVLGLASKADRIQAPPECVKALLADIGEKAQFQTITEGDDDSGAPSHMDLIVGKRAANVRAKTLHWVLDLATARR